MAESEEESEVRGGKAEDSIGLGVKEGEAGVRGGKEVGEPNDGAGYAGESMGLDGGSSGSVVVGMGVERSGEAMGLGGASVAGERSHPWVASVEACEVHQLFGRNQPVMGSEVRQCISRSPSCKR